MPVAAEMDLEQAQDAVRRANAELARRAVAPIWYHPALGLLAGGLVAVQYGPLVLRIVYLPLFAAGLALLVSAYKRRTGLWVSGYRPGRTRLVSAALAIVSALIAAGALLVGYEQHRPAAFIVGGGVLAILFTISGFVWEAAFRADLRAAA